MSTPAPALSGDIQHSESGRWSIFVSPVSQCLMNQG